MIRPRSKPIDDGMLISKQRSRAIVYGARKPDASAHYEFVARFRCCVPACGRHPVHVHHRLRAKRGMGTKAPPCEAVPLCPQHHLACYSSGVHHWGNEAAWEAHYGVDLRAIASVLWAASPSNINKKEPA